jgi:hypothetical protein
VTRALGALAGFVDDRLNPIVVKELRQAVQGRFVAAVLLLFLLFELATLTVFLLTIEPAGVDWTAGGSRGREVFAFILGFLLFVTVVTLPAYAAVRVFVEQAGDSLSLVFVTTLPPGRIVAGKLLAAQLLALVLFSACLPFVSFTYFLRGIDLPSILVVFGFGFVVVTTAVQAAILLACLPASRFLKVMLGIGGLAGLVVVFSVTVTVGLELVSAGVGSRLGTRDFWIPAGVFLGIAGFLVTLGYLASVALVSPAVANRAPPVRSFLSLTWLVSGVLVAYVASRSASDDELGVWTVTWAAVAVAACVVAVGARDEMSRRVAQEVPRPRWRRVPAFFLWSGSANGVAWAAALAILTVAAGAAVAARTAAPNVDDWLFPATGLAGYGFAYSTSALLLHRRFLARRVHRRYTWVLALALAAAGSVLPPIAGFLVLGDFARSSDARAWMILNPFAPSFAEIGTSAAWLGLTWAGTTAALAAPWFLRQVRAFAPPEGS